MQNAITKVVIVGGGTAGWISAGVIAKKLLDSDRDDVKVTLIESSDLPTIGVGEGTWPTLRHTMRKIGISENDLVRECDATFKQGAKFARWTTGKDDDYYYHPFNVTEGYPKLDIAPYWLAKQPLDTGRPLHGNGSFSDATCWQEHLCELGLAPKTLGTAEYADIANYAYHIDAGKLATLLKKHCIEKLNVTHVVDSVVCVNQSENGFITSVDTENHNTISGDLFVDCTGLASLLLGQTMQVPFVDHSDCLFINSAIAMQAPYPNGESPIATHTISTAQPAGWVWDIGLSSRRGLGHVYSSDHCTDDAAEQTLRNYIGPAEKDLSARRIKFTNGHRENFWVKNCVGIGMSAGFLEPLEATAIMLIEISATMVAEQFPPCFDVIDLTAQRFNNAFHYRWRAIIDFLKLHYVLSQREEEFWVDNRDASTIPDSLQDLLTLWKYQAPSDYDFSSQYELFKSPSYQFVLYGMAFETDYSNLSHTLNKQAEADQYFTLIDRAKQKYSQNLPTHRDLIERVKRHGFQTI